MRSFGKPAQGERLERLHDLPLWDGERLRNIHPVLPGLRDTSAPRPTLREFSVGDAGRTPPAPLPAEDPRGAWLKPPASGLRATWLGHSTVLLEIDGVARADRSRMGSARVAVHACSGPSASSRCRSVCATCPRSMPW